MDDDLGQEIRNLWNQGSLRVMVEIIPHGMVVVNEYGHIVLVNRHTESIFGYSRGDLLGQPLAILIPERFHKNHPLFHHQYFANPVSQAIGTGRDLFGLRKDGSEVPLEIGLTPVRISEGFFILNEIVDISVRKQAEAKAIRIKEIAAQESERRRLARELHDELGQLLNVISFDLQTAKQACGATVPQLDDDIRRVNRAIEQVRNLTFDLRPPMLDDLGLVATLRWYADRHLRNAGLVLHFSSESYGNALSTDLSTTCYRVVQEALANVVRHAQAREVWIEFTEKPDVVLLSIRDNGVGFNPDMARKRVAGDASFGVIGMKERVEILGGTIEIKSQPSQGTMVGVSIPLTSAEVCFSQCDGNYSGHVNIRDVKGVQETESNPSLIS